MTAKRTKSKLNTESLGEGQGGGRRKAPRAAERRTSEGSPKGEAEDAGVTAGETAQVQPDRATKPEHNVNTPSQRAQAGENFGVTAGRDRQPNSQDIYVRSFDGATMVEVAPHQFVNASLSIVSKRKAGDE